MLKSIVISILRVNWLFGSNSSYHIKHRTQQYMFNNIDQSKWIKNCSQKHQLVCQSTFYFILVLTWCDHVGQSNLQLKLFEKKQQYTHTRAHTHTLFFWMTIHHCMNLYHPTNILLTIWPFWSWLVSSCFAGG